MKADNQNGVTLLEIIIAVTLIIILAEPITNMIMQIVNTNVRAQKVKDATLLAQQYSELIQNKSADADTLVTNGSDTVSFNGGSYYITCTLVGGGGGGGGAVTIPTPHLIVDGTASGSITVKSDSGTVYNDSSYTNPLPYTNYSVIINSDTIIITKNNANEPHTTTVQSDFVDPVIIKHNGSDIKLADLGNKIKIDCETTSGRYINLYNFSSNPIDVYYDSTQIDPKTTQQLKIKYDTTASAITLHDTKPGTAVAGTNLTYELKIMEQGSTSALITRKVTTIN